MISACAACGAPLPEGGRCLDLFHAMLALEGRVPGGPGETVHFLAVASYQLQHPAGFVPEAIHGLRRALDDALAGRATVADLRRRTRRAADGPVRVLRRDGEPRDAPAGWPTRWPMTVADVCREPPERFAERVRSWAASVADALAHALPPT